MQKPTIAELETLLDDEGARHVHIQPDGSLRVDMRMDTPWPLPDVLAKLIEATEHLLSEHDCDTHGHEEFRAAVDAAKAILKGFSEDHSQ